MRTICLYLLFFMSFIGQAWAEVNINTATAKELTALKGVGPATAEKIIAYRDTNGPFAACADLVNVKGIGNKTMEKIAPDCTTGNPDEIKPEGTDGKKAAVKKATAGIDINTASAQQLEALKGIGKKTAQAIVEYREQHGPFKSCDGLIKVKGIGPKKLAQFRTQCSVIITPQK